MTAILIQAVAMAVKALVSVETRIRAAMVKAILIPIIVMEAKNPFLEEIMVLATLTPTEALVIATLIHLEVMAEKVPTLAEISRMINHPEDTAAVNLIQVEVTMAQVLLENMETKIKVTTMIEVSFRKGNFLYLINYYLV